jgi:hypothetical protein
MPLDLARLSRVLGLLGSDHDGECLAAARQAQRMIRVNGMQWADFIEAAAQRDKAEQRASDLYDAAVILERQRDAALAQVARLRSANGHTVGSIALWQNAGSAPGGSANRVAQWLLDLHARGLFHLMPKEIDFLDTCCRWRGALTANQQPWFDDLLDRARGRGFQPPP